MQGEWMFTLNSTVTPWSVLLSLKGCDSLPPCCSAQWGCYQITEAYSCSAAAASKQNRLQSQATLRAVTLWKDISKISVSKKTCSPRLLIGFVTASCKGSLILPEYGVSLMQPYRLLGDPGGPQTSIISSTCPQDMLSPTTEELYRLQS